MAADCSAVQTRLIFYDSNGQVTSDVGRSMRFPWRVDNCEAAVPSVVLNGFIFLNLSSPDATTLYGGYRSDGSDGVIDMVCLSG